MMYSGWIEVGDGGSGADPNPQHKCDNVTVSRVFPDLMGSLSWSD